MSFVDYRPGVLDISGNPKRRWGFEKEKEKQRRGG